MATQAHLVMRTGPNPGKTFSLTKPETFVGRDISNDIVINDAEVSRKHVRLSLQGNQHVVEDLGSTNGTFVNGQRIAGPHMLSSGETIQMGENVVLVFETVQVDPDATAVMSSREAAAVEMPPVSMPEPEAEPMPEPISEPAPEPMPEPEPMPAQTMSEPAAPPPPPDPEPSTTYTGPAMPEAPPMAEPEEKKGNRRMLFAGCGCLAILACIAVVAGLYYVDANSLWCDFLPFLTGC